MKDLIEALPKKVKEVEKETKKYFQKIKKRAPKKLDVVVQDLHDETFENINCLDCANCCKTTSPIFTEKDIARISKHLKMKEVAFIDNYLQRDEDHFWVLKEAPCSFLDLQDNTCQIYDVRPKACTEYPHTNRRRFSQLTSLTMNNMSICPAVFDIVEALKKKLPL